MSPQSNDIPGDSPDGVALSELQLDVMRVLWRGEASVAEVAAVGFSRRDGLGSDYVRVVLQSEDRALWIGHAEGLDRWHQRRMQRVRLAVKVA